MPGIEQNADYTPLLNQLQGSAVAGMQNAANAAGPLTIHANVVVDSMGAPGGLAPATPVPGGYTDPTSGQTPAQASAMAQAWQFSSVNAPLGSYPNPMATPDIYRSARANEMWEGIQHQGFLYSLREVQGGQFDPWMGSLTGGSKLQADEVARAARRKEGHQIAGASEEMGSAGQKIYQLMQTIEAAGHGTPAAAKAAEEVAKLLAVIDRLAESAGKAADSIGGDAGAAAKTELQALAASAKGGMEAPGGGIPVPSGGGAPGGRISAAKIAALVHNPSGTLAGMAEMGLYGVAAKGLGSFLSADAMMALGIPAAVAGAGYLGWNAPVWYGEWENKDAAEDATRRIQDARLSAVIGGRQGDLRGTLWNADRTGFSKETSRRQINTENVRQAIQALGVSFEGSSAFGNQMDFYESLDKNVSRRNAEFGLADGSLESFIGQEMRSGGLKREDYVAGVDRLAGYLEAANKIGITSSEKLSTLAALNQSIVAKVGYLSSDTEHYMSGFQSFLENTGVAALRGQQGVQIMSENTSNWSNEAQAGLYSELMNMDKGTFDKTVRQAAGSDKAYENIMRATKGDRSTLAYLLLQQPNLQLQYRQRVGKELGFLNSAVMFGFGATFKEGIAAGAMEDATPGAVHAAGSHTSTPGAAYFSPSDGDRHVSAVSQELQTSQNYMAVSGLQSELLKNRMATGDLITSINNLTKTMSEHQDSMAHFARSTVPGKQSPEEQQYERERIRLIYESQKDPANQH